MRYECWGFQTKFTIDGLVETLRRTKLRFVHCLLPQHNAGLCETNASLMAVKTSGQPDDSLINVPLLRSQVRNIKRNAFLSCLKSRNTNIFLFIVYFITSISKSLEVRFSK